MGSLIETRARALAGDGVIVNKAWASRHHLHVGDPLVLPTPSGEHAPRIVGLSDVPNPVQGELGIDFDRFTRWYQRTGATGFEVITRPGADQVAIQRAVERIVAPAPVRIHVFTGPQVLAGSLTSLSQITTIFNVMIWVTVAATALAVLNTMAIAVVERRRELGILRSLGTGRSAIRRMVVIEAAAISAAGAAIGISLGLVQQVAGVRATGTITGFTVHYRFAVAPLLLAAAAASAMAVGGSIGPAWRAAEVDVITAIGYE